MPRKPREEEKRPCKCGCGNLTSGAYNHYKYRYVEYINGHSPKSEETKRKMSIARKKWISNNRDKLIKSSRKQSETKKRLFKEGKIIPSRLGVNSEFMKKWHKENEHPMLGKKLSKETKKKISLANTGRKHTEEYKKKMSKRMKRLYKEGKIKVGCKGKKFSKEHRRKIGLANKRRVYSEETLKKMSIAKKGKYTLENHPGWLGGKSFEPYTCDFNARFKRKIKERDHYTCQLCNIYKEDLYLLKRRLCVHHINYDKLLSISENCITLCSTCHPKTNTNRTHWTKFFQSLLSERYGYEYNEKQEVILDFNEVKK